MMKLLPGNIIYGGNYLSEESKNYRSLGHYLLSKLKSYSKQILYIDASKDVKYSGKYVYDEVARLAQVLQKLGVQQGDVVSLYIENRIEFIIALLATFAINATVAPINITYSRQEVQHAVNLSKPKLIFASDKSSKILADVCKNSDFIKIIITVDQKKSFNSNQIQTYLYKELLENRSQFPSNPTFEPSAARDKKDDVALIVCSSGTTGMPKGVQLTQNNVMRSIEANASLLSIDDGMIAVLPWFHVYGCFCVIRPVGYGNKLVFLEKFQNEMFLRAIQKYRPLVGFVVPPIMVFLAKHPLVDKYDLSSLKKLSCGAAPLSKKIMDQVCERIGIATIRQGYGLSEATLVVTVQTDAICTPGSIGILLPGSYAKVVDPDTGKLLGPNQPGELCFKSECIMKGYIGDAKATQSTIIDGWLHTGDVGYYTEQLEFFIVDRIKELIKYKGFQVPPAELEALLLTNSAISDAAVIGRPDEEAGELPMAFIVPQPGAKLTEEEVVKFVQDRTSAAKRLRGGVEFIKEIPKNASGKILRRVLRDTIKQQNPKSKL